MTNHTQGEWKIDQSEEWVICVVCPWSDKNKAESSATFGDYRGSIICSMHYNTGVPTKEQALNNAKLIAAAPDLLETLQRLLRVYPASTSLAQTAAKVKAYAAIKKATK